MGFLETDILIQGGGPVGGTFALLMANAGFKVSIVDHLPLKTLEGLQEDHRGFTLSHRSKTILDSAGIWSFLEAEAEPILKIQVSNGNHPYYLNFQNEDNNAPAMGYLVDAHRLRRVIFQACIAHANITWYANATIQEIIGTSKSKRATLTTGQTLETPLIIGADGKNSPLRALCDISMSTWNYNQSALIFTVEVPFPHHNIAFEKFLPTGPFAILPMTKNRLAIVWTHRPDAAEILLDMKESAFLEYLSQPLEIASQHLKLLTKRYCYPLMAQHADSYVQPGIALVGDAAHVIHPLAGQGLNLGFKDIELLTKSIMEARELGLDMGSLSVLEPYSTERRRDIWLMLQAMNGFNRLFSNYSIILNKLRGFGLAGFEKMPLCKKVALGYVSGPLKFRK